ncbi:MAG TPA: DUF881 domain-containing protein [Cellulomonas sp.]
MSAPQGPTPQGPTPQRTTASHLTTPHPTTPRRVDASMSLLTEVIRNPLDPGYRAAAERRARAGGRAGRSGTATVAVLVLAVLLGAATTWSVLELRAPQPSAVAAREVLAEQITERSAEVEELRAQSTTITAQIAALQQEVLSAQDSPLLDQLAADSLVSGATAVTGDGLRITLTDADVVDPDDDPDSRVRDSDLQIVVNGLWASGAEAIAVNGERLTSTTAIRTAGDAILVDVVPLVGPYTIEAIGDSQGMQTRLAGTTAGQLLAVLQSTYGIRTQITSQHDLALPGAGTTTLRSAGLPDGVVPVPDDGAAADGVAAPSDDAPATDRANGASAPFGTLDQSSALRSTESKGTL